MFRRLAWLAVTVWAAGCGSAALPTMGAGGHAGTVGNGGTGAAGAGGGGSGGRGGAAGGMGGMAGGGAGGIVGSGGIPTGSGGATGSGGIVGAGGSNPTGGVSGAGGRAGSGGLPATGGVTGSGGITSTGGVAGSGGIVGTGGMAGTAGCGAACTNEWDEWPVPNSLADVSNGAPNPEAYTVNSDQTVTDKVTGLMWQQTVAPGTYSWSQAVAYCSTLMQGNHMDWRLPTENELLSIVDYSVGNDYVHPTIDATTFPNTPLNTFWSVTPSADSSSSAWNVNFWGGSTTTNILTDAFYVRCVR